MITRIKNSLLLHSTLYFILCCVLNPVLSIIPRLPFLRNITSPWRASQTLLTSFWFQKDGISLFNYQTPIFGPPWKVPFEFPLYQALCTIFSNIVGKSILTSSHAVSLMIFYISALFLLLLCLEFLNSKSLSFIILVVYLWLPYDIRYSTEILIDYLSVTLALGYIFLMKKWFDSPRNYLVYTLAVISGCLGAVVKITTMPIVIIPAILIALNGMSDWGIRFEDLFSLKNIINPVRKNILSLILLAALAILPLILAMLWTRFTDGVKQANIYTQWLTSANQSLWYYGPLAMKLDFAYWLKWLENIHNYFFWGILLIFPILGILFLYKLPIKSRCFFGSALVGSFLVIFIFFNLYLHEYYYISISAYMSVLIGFGIYCLYKFILPHNVWWMVFSFVFLFFIILGGVAQYKTIQSTVKAEIDGQNKNFSALAKRAAAITPEDEYIISFQSDWYPDFILFTKRKGLILSPRNRQQFTCASIANIKYTTIVDVYEPLSYPKDFGLLNCFKSVKLIEPGLYKVVP